jgi:hypothetical protein
MSPLVLPSTDLHRPSTFIKSKPSVHVPPPPLIHQHSRSSPQRLIRARIPRPSTTSTANDVRPAPSQVTMIWSLRDLNHHAAPAGSLSASCVALSSPHDARATTAPSGCVSLFSALFLLSSLQLFPFRLCSVSLFPAGIKAISPWIAHTWKES